jgi:hypothetical protein
MCVQVYIIQYTDMKPPLPYYARRGVPSGEFSERDQ